MFSPPSTVRTFVHSQPTDMQKSFDGLAAIVGNQFSNLFAGNYSVFFNRLLHRYKILLGDRDRYVFFAQNG